MTSNIILEAIKVIIDQKVAKKIKLEKPSDQDGSEREFVKPIVEIGYLPPKNFLPEGFDIPCIIVGADKGSDTGDDSQIKIKFIFATYGPGTYKEDNRLIPNMQGYKDLLSLIEKTRTELSSNPIVDGVTVIGKPIEWAMYEEQPWPYWYGWMTCYASCMVQDQINSDFL